MLDIELMVVKVVNKYVREVKPEDLEKNKSVFKTFLKVFVKLDGIYQEKELTKHGFFALPVHRCFSYYITRYLGSQAR